MEKIILTIGELRSIEENTTDRWGGLCRRDLDETPWSPYVSLQTNLKGKYRVFNSKRGTMYEGTSADEAVNVYNNQ